VPSKTSESKPALLTTAPSGASEPCRIVMPPVAWIGSLQRADDVAVDVRRRDVGEVLGQRPAGDGERAAVQQPGVQQRLHDDRDAADAVDVGHHVPAERLDVGQVRHRCADPVKSSRLEVDVGLVRDREQVQDGVRRAAERHDDGDRVLERLRVRMSRAVIPRRSSSTTAAPGRRA
jgi:hypothetical protein